MNPNDHSTTTEFDYTHEPRCEGLAPFDCGNPYCPVHGLDPDIAGSIIASLRARLDAVSDLADALVGNEAAPLIREALNGYVRTPAVTTAGDGRG